MAKAIHSKDYEKMTLTAHSAAKWRPMQLWRKPWGKEGNSSVPKGAKVLYLHSHMSMLLSPLALNHLDPIGNGKPKLLIGYGHILPLIIKAIFGDRTVHFLD